MNDHVKFYSIGDLSTPMQVDAVSGLLEKIASSDYNFDSVNSVLELINLIKFMNEPKFCKLLSEKTVKKFTEQKGLFYSVVNSYFEDLDTVLLKRILSEIDDIYLEDFLDKYAEVCVNRVTEEEFKDVWLKSNKYNFYLFKNKKLVDIYANTCKEIFLGDPSNIELLLENYIDGCHLVNTIPSTISNDEMYQLCVDYVMSERANPKYLDVILRVSGEIKKYLIVDPDLQLLVKKRKAEILGELAKTCDVRTESYFAIYSKRSDYDKALRTRKPNEVLFLMDEKWLDYDCSYPTVLNSLRYVYELFTPDAISLLPSYPKLEMELSDIFGEMKTKKSYKKGQYFESKQGYNVCKMQMLDTLLSERGVSITNIVNWFYYEYCKKEFNVKWLKFPMPVEIENITNKTATLFRAEENIRKQYYVYCKKNAIDQEYIKCLNTPNFNELLSLGNRPKYVYFGVDSILEEYAGLLFSTQSGLNVTKFHVTDQNLYELLKNGTYFIDDFNDYQKSRIQGLLNFNVLRNYENGIGLGDLNTVKMLYRLFYFGVVCSWYLDGDSCQLMDNWGNNGLLVYGNTLFSRPEIDYLNFCVNNSSFNNSLGLRNKYQHGFDDSNEKSSELYFDYYMALLIHIIYVIKIHEELIFRLPETDRDRFNCVFVDGF